MQIDHEKLAAGVLKINLTGRMDATGSQEIETRFTELTSQPGLAVVVDLSQVQFLASIGIRTLLVYAKALKGHGGRMVLLKPDPGVARVLEVSGLDTLIGVFRNLDDACAALSSRSTGNP